MARQPIRRAFRPGVFLTAIGAAIGLASALLSGASHAVTLEEALIQAYLTNPELLAARAELRATDENVAQAVSGWRPTVTITGDVGKTHSSSQGGSSSGSGSQNRTPRSGALRVLQNLYEGGRTTAEIGRSENQVQAQRARLLETEQSVILKAATSYMDVVRDQAVLELNIHNEKVLQRQLDAARDRFRVGEVTRTDVAQAESRRSRATAERIRSEGNLISSRAVFRNVVGDSPGTLKPAGPLENLPANEEETVSLARANAPSVFVARFNERAARDDVRVNSSDFLPVVDIEGALTRRDEASSPRSRSETASVTARLTVPLYQAGGVASRVRQAKQVAAQRRRELDRTIRDVVERATRGWEALATARAQIKSFTAEVRAATIALEGVEQEASVGSRTILDVLDAEQELLDAKVNLVRAERDEVVAAFDLVAAIGDLTAKKLALPVKLYDLGAHYRAVRNKWIGSGIQAE
jgi:TolC family type I secretion outer membrane protein